MTIDIPDLIDRLKHPWCPACGGEGYFIITGESGYYDPHMGNWYPTEHNEPCDDCLGTGDITNAPGQLGDVIRHLTRLTDQERADLQNLYEPNGTVRVSSYQALWKFLENIEIDTEPDEPAAEELYKLLANCTLIESASATTSTSTYLNP